MDQRDNRAIIRQLARDRTVLNLFSFSGGFSVAAGAGGCQHATSVDLAPAAIADATRHWQLNVWIQTNTLALSATCFEYLEQVGNKSTWDIVICDPPSFAPSERSRARSGRGLSTSGHTLRLKLLPPGGLLALCLVLQSYRYGNLCDVNLAGIGRARRVGTVLDVP